MIIGVVAAIVIPILNKGTDDVALRAAGLKAQSSLSNAILKMEENNSGEIWDNILTGSETISAQSMRDEFGKYLGFIKKGSLGGIFTPPPLLLL